MNAGIGSEQIHTNGSMPESEIQGEDLFVDPFARPEVLAALAFLGGFILALFLRRGRARRGR